MSTTVRNPNRIKDFLYVLNMLDGQEWNDITQAEYQILLIKERFYTPTELNLTENQINILNDPTHKLSYDEAKDIFYSKDYRDPSMRGRTSYKPLQKWGLVSLEDRKIKISNTGKMLLSNQLDLGDVCFKSLLKWQLLDSTYNIKPFVATLLLIDKVNQLCKNNGEKVKGISKEELGIFALSITNYKDIAKKAQDIIYFRRELSKADNKNTFLNSFLNNYLKEYCNINNISDYTDNIIRYFRLTRYIYIRGSGYHIDIEPRRYIEISNLLSQEDGSALKISAQEYNKYLCDYTKPELPWETLNILKQIASRLYNDIVKSDYINLIEFDNKDIEQLSLDELKLYIKYLRNIRSVLNNLLLKDNYSSITKIEEAISCLLNIRCLDIKPSIALEKWTHIALNIINDAREIKPNYPVGDDNEPTYTAPSNVPDIECYYQDFSSICEVTMLTSRDQWYNEGQPVQRHLRDFEEIQNNENVYCLFIAPKLHRDTINTFWNSNKYEYEGKKQKIIPITITQLIVILEFIKNLKQKNIKFNNSMLKKLFDNIITQVENKNNSIEWLENIDNNISNWKENILESIH